MTAEHAELRRLAMDATPGPWQSLPGPADVAGWDIFRETDEDELRWVGFGHAEADVRYIAAVSPDVVVRLLDRVTELEQLHARRHHDRTP